MSHQFRLSAAVIAVLLVVTSAAAHAQPIGQVVELSGPRFGVTFLSGGVVDRLKKDANISVGSMVTQFGWQTEKRYTTLSEGITPVTEFVFLAGGLEQNKFLPSVTGMIGLRTGEGFEIGIGPNLTPISASLAFAAGVTYRTGALNVPVNVAIVPSDAGVRVSVLSGFNLRSR